MAVKAVLDVLLKLSKLPKRIWIRTVAAGRTVQSFNRRLLHGAEKEKKKTVSRNAPKHALANCLIHILPLCAVVILSYFNWAGFFIGSKLQGFHDSTSQDISRLCLQVTAKLVVY